jgi:hypothetical protein
VSAVYEHTSASICELDDDLIYLRIGLDAREEDVDPLFENFRPLVVGRDRIRVLFDASRLAEAPARVRWEFVRRMVASQRGIARLAIFGLTARMEALLCLAVTLTRRRNVRAFMWRHEAESWLDTELP